MAFTVKQLAKVSGVSVRTLHFYDEAGLLQPARRGANGYRFYGKPQLLALQQILFYRRLGFELKQIKKILSRPDFDRIIALESHRKVLKTNLAETQRLIATIDKTIQHLKGKKKMKHEELFVGFSPEQQATHEQYLINRFGEGMQTSISQSKAKVKNWTKGDWESAGAVFDGICRELTGAMIKEVPVDASEVQSVVRRHYEWLKRFWTPTRESYAGHSQLIVDSELRKAYETYDRGLPEYAATAMKVFAENELS